jgi:hypothetical protein
LKVTKPNPRLRPVSRSRITILPLRVSVHSGCCGGRSQLKLGT